MTQEEQVRRVLAIMLYQLGGQTQFTQQLLDAMPDYKIVWTESEGLVTLDLQNNTVLIGSVDNEVVTVQ